MLDLGLQTWTTVYKHALQYNYRHIHYDIPDMYTETVDH